MLRLQIPPLRERLEDIPLLAAHFLALLSPKGKTAPRLNREAEEVLRQYRWPGNLRELRNLMERMAALHKKQVIDKAGVAAYLAEEQAELLPCEIAPDIEDILHALAASKGNQSKAAELLGISRSTLWRRLKKGRER